MRLSFAAVALGTLLAVACSSTNDPSSPSEGGGTTAPTTSPGPSPTSTVPPPPPLGDGLGAYPVPTSPKSRGGTMTFTNLGAPGFWPRRIDRPEGDPACDYKDGKDTWGGRCCMKKQATTSDRLAPFDEETTLVLKAIDLKQLAVYQPAASGTGWALVSSWDRRTRTGKNLGFTRGPDQEPDSTGELQKTDCVSYAAQTGMFDCGDGRDYFCPNDPGAKRLGWRGSKLFVMLASATFDDAGVASCNGNGTAHPGPWVALVASELVRDGARKWNGACNCYSKTGTVGDGCGEINLFEVVMDNNAYSNREFASTGVRSFQAGHVGGNVCGTGCSREQFPDDTEVVDACAKKAYDHGPVIPVGGKADGCPVWKRPRGDRYFLVLLDELTRTMNMAIVHPENVPSALAPILPQIPATLGREAIDALAATRLPEAK